MTKINYKIAEQVLNVILSSLYLYFAIQQWLESTQCENRIIVCVFVTLLIGVQNTFILFRFCLPNQRRYDFHITIMYFIIYLINSSDCPGNGVFSLELNLSSVDPFTKYNYLFFFGILLVNTLYYALIGFSLLVIAGVSLVQIWYSSDSIVNREGLTSQEFESLPCKVVSAKESQNMKSSYHSGIHNHQLNDCAICLSTFEHNEVMIEIVQCKHIFHSDCIKVWFKNSVLCPYCRNDVRKALQKIKREKHQLQHAGHSILDKIVDQAEPSFQLEEFIEDNDLRGQQQNPQNIQQQQQIQDINENQNHGQNNQNNVNNSAGGRNANPIFQNNQNHIVNEVNVNSNSNQNQQQNQQNQRQAHSRSQSSQDRNSNNQNNNSRQIYQYQQVLPSPRYPFQDDILSNSQSIQLQQLNQSQNLQQSIFQQQAFQQQLQQQQQQQQQQQHQELQQAQQQQQQQQRRGPIRIVEPPSPRRQQSQQRKSPVHSRANSFGSNDEQFYQQLQQQHQDFQIQIRKSQENLGSSENHSPKNYYADGAGYSNKNKKLLDEFSFYEEQENAEVFEKQQHEAK